MRIEVQCSINSGQYNKGDVIDISDDTANLFIKSGFAVKVSNDIEISSPKLIHREIPEHRRNPSPIVEAEINEKRKRGRPKKILEEG